MRKVPPPHFDEVCKCSCSRWKCGSSKRPPRCDSTLLCEKLVWGKKTPRSLLVRRIEHVFGSSTLGSMVRFVPVFVGVAWLAGLKQVTASSSLPLWRADNHPCATTTTKDRIAAFSPSSTPHQDLPSGVRNAATEFGADPTGQTDSTRALQTAIDAAQTQNFTIFLPVGCYVVTDMLNACLLYTSDAADE